MICSPGGIQFRYKSIHSNLISSGFSTTEGDLSEPIDNLRNLGPTSASWLREVGITTIAELRRLGPVLAYRLVKQKQLTASLNLLWALAAGILDRDWRELSEEEKEKLRAEVETA